jgi:hypothetical protein
MTPADADYIELTDLHLMVLLRIAAQSRRMDRDALKGLMNGPAKPQINTIIADLAKLGFISTSSFQRKEWPHYTWLEINDEGNNYIRFLVHAARQKLAGN